MKSQFIYSLGTFILLLMFVSCNKFDDNYDYAEITAVSAINAVPGSKGVDIFLDDNKLNSAWNETFAYQHILGYRNAYPGNRSIRLFNRNVSIADSALINKQVTFKAGHYYSLYLIGQSQLELLTIEDDFIPVVNGTAKFRFLNLASTAQRLNLSLNDVDSLEFKDKAYKDLSAFKSIKAGESYQLSINGTEIETLTGTFKPDNGAIYTIYTSGLISTNDPEKRYNFQIVKHR